MTLTLYGFNGSTYVRAVRMLLAEKGAPYDQVPVDVLAGEPRQPEHLKRHPFGKVPVIEHDGVKVMETGAILRYLNDVLPGPSFVPDTPKDRARMDQAIALIDSYGYGALLGGVSAYHLFPDFVGGRNEEGRQKGLETGGKVVDELMRLRGSSAFLAGDRPSLADFVAAPVLFYVSMTPDKDAVFGRPGLADWWRRVEDLESFRSTPPM